MRKLILLSLLFCSSLFAADDSAKLEAAKRYLATTPVSETLDELAEKMSAQMPPAHRARFIQVMTEQLDHSRLEQASLEALVHTFTLEELNALADFYGSEVGKAVVAKMGDYMAIMMPLIQEEMLAAAHQLQQQEPME
ncbi:DUF2059 domain-containing protein [Ferrimonas marina]|uniref:DUF2059 domain-containing protein n=1 Tax=Ferrimonas marina TaxID=299255 RepID=A0A1M5NU51_9GAMM|nr:DUF2059 domain-containing protein [Ferrimonas marina]SHG92998.1 hypothetical protein SAMN02745129_1178 [Ferrimonas marina]